MKKLLIFVKECRLELKKVSWPTREDVLQSTKVVLVSVVFFAVLFGALDYGLFSFINFIF